MSKLQTIAYIDGFNFYHGALQDKPACKWLNLWDWAECLLRMDEELRLVRYFTARVGGTTMDPAKPQRQDVYLRALSSLLGRVVIHEGHFKDRRKPGHSPQDARSLWRYSSWRKRGLT